MEAKDGEMIAMDGDGESWSRGKMLGKGAFATVYVATSNGNGNGSFPRVMAVKSADIALAETLQHEKNVMSSLAGCSSIIQCYGAELTCNPDGSEVYNLLLEYCSGGSLWEKIGNKGLPELEVRWYTRSIVEGLIKIREAGFVHCDLKPDNILLFPTTDGHKFQFQAKICDFGGAKGVREDRNKGELLRTLYGTPGYIGPEVVQGGPQESPTDIWALGIMVLEMLTGRYAWDSEDGSEVGGDEIISKLQEKDVLPVIPEYLSPMAKSFIRSCLTRKVKKRATACKLLRHPFVAGIDQDAASSSTHSLSFQKIGYVFHRLGSILRLF